MSAIELVSALALEVRSAVETYRLEADRQPRKAITVYEQFIPKAHMNDPSGQYHPLVVVTCRGVMDDEDNTIAEAGLTFGVYGESTLEEEPWRDLLNVMESVRLRLLERQLIGGCYRLMRPLEMEYAEVQPAPFFYGEMTARYVMYQPVERGSAR